MNREILFKAKRKDNGEWVKGQYAYINNPLTENGEPRKHLICNGTNIFNYEIDQDTLCQYTGLNDNTKWEDLTESEKELFLSNWNYQEDRKNKVEDWKGKRIWENDIVRDKTGDIFRIYWSEQHLNYSAKCVKSTFSVFINQKWDLGTLLKSQIDVEVCGNIFDSADLLEVE